MGAPRPARTAALSGILVVAKPVGPTSHDVVALVRRLSGTRRIGHGGTLDPFASGVLPLFLGTATRLVEYHMADRKTYRATFCFGASSSTDDLEGELEPADGPALVRARVEAALERFRGTVVQRPPAYSAVKVAGRRAYAIARSGEEPEIPLREVTIHRLELERWDDTDPTRPVAVVEVECSAGTYVRALARDLGAALGSAAYLGALTRLRSGSFSLDEAHGLDAVRGAAATGPAGLAALLLPPDAGLEHLARVTLNDLEVEAIVRGQFVRPQARVDATFGSIVRAQSADGSLVAIAEWHHDRLAPTKVLRPLPAADEGVPPEDDAAATPEPAT